MIVASVHDVAAYLTEKITPVGTMKLEKLVYYAQGWYLARNPMPLFPESIEAWKMGPVSRELYNYHRRQNWVTEWPQGSSANLTEQQRQHIDAIIDAYGQFSGFQLGTMTHQEAPWLRAMGHGQNTVIEQDDMREFFSSIDTVKAEQLNQSAGNAG